MLKLLLSSLEELFVVFEPEQTLKEAMAMDMWTVLRPNISEGSLRRSLSSVGLRDSVRGLTC